MFTVSELKSTLNLVEGVRTARGEPNVPVPRDRLPAQHYMGRRIQEANAAGNLERGLEGTKIVTTPAGTTLAIPQEINYTPDNKKVGNTKPKDISPYAVPRRKPGGEYEI